VVELFPFLEVATARLARTAASLATASTIHALAFRSDLLHGTLAALHHLAELLGGTLLEELEDLLGDLLGLALATAEGERGKEERTALHGSDGSCTTGLGGARGSGGDDNGRARHLFVLRRTENFYAEQVTHAGGSTVNCCALATALVRR